MGDTEISDELVDQLLSGYQAPEDLTGPDGLINRLRRGLIEHAAGAELTAYLGYEAGGEPPDGQANRRNGVSRKTLRTVDGPVTVELPRDRDSSFAPRSCPSVRSFDGFDDQILALYAGGMTTREIGPHLRELYGWKSPRGSSRQSPARSQTTSGPGRPGPWTSSTSSSTWTP